MQGESEKIMYNANNIRTLKKVVKEMKQGEKLYINTISLSVNTIEQLYNDIPAVISGKTILPQMTYIKQ